MTKEITGLTKREVEASRLKNGSNIFKKESKKGFFARFFANLNDPIIKVLIVAVFVEITISLGNVNFFEVGGIISAIMIAATVSTLSELGSEKAFEKINNEGKKEKK